MSFGKGSHVRTRIPSSTYNFKWSFEHFSKLLPGKKVTSPEFYPISGSKWYSTLEKSSSFINWTMCNADRTGVHVIHAISVVGSRGKVWMKKAIQKEYDSFNDKCGLIGESDKISADYLLCDMMTFSCFMTLTGNEIVTETVELQAEASETIDNLKKLSNDLKTLYGVSLYTDVCLKVGSDVLRVHKAILCARSPVFAKMFEHKMGELETGTVEIIDLEIGVLKDLISFLYTGVVPNEDITSVFALYYASDKYDVEDLRNTCGHILRSKFDVDNACRILSLADRHSDEPLKTSVMTFIDIYLESILLTDGWKDLVNNETKLAAEIMNTRAAVKSNKDKIEVNSKIAVPAVSCFNQPTPFGTASYRR